MKKVLVYAVMFALVLGFGTTAMAGYDTQTAITSESITGVVMSCEKYGAVTFTFNAGTRIKDGDRMYFDLPMGVELCYSFDFVVLGKYWPGMGALITVPNAAHDGGLKNDNLGVVGTPLYPATNGGSMARGPWKIIDLGGQAGVGDLVGQQMVAIIVANSGAGGAMPTYSGNSMFVRVRGVEGVQDNKLGRRVELKFYDDENPASMFAPENKNGSTEIYVGADMQLTLTLFDGKPWDGIKANQPVYCEKDTDIDGLYGEVAADLLQSATGNIWDNFLCCRIWRKQASDLNSFPPDMQYVNVSFDSDSRTDFDVIPPPVGAVLSGDDFLTFQGQREIAHIMGQSANFKEDPCKTRKCGNIIIGTTGQTTGTCNAFDNETGANYCAGTHGANKLVIEAGTYFEPDVAYYIEAKILVNGAYVDGGVYFSDQVTGIGGFAARDYTNCGYSVNVPIVGTYKYKTATGTAATPAAPIAGTCGLAAAAHATYMMTPAVTWWTANNIKYLYIDWPAFNYDPAIVKSGDKVEVQYTVSKAPCGVITTGTWCIGTFGCTAAVVKNAMLYPYYTQINKSESYWDGIAITNVGAVNGTATIYVYEQDGDVAKTAAIPVNARSMFVSLLSDLTLTKTAGTGTVGDARNYVVVCTDFMCDGFAMMGDTKDGYSMGYLPRTTGTQTNNTPVSALCP